MYTWRESDGQYRAFWVTQDGSMATSAQGNLLGVNNLIIVASTVTTGGTGNIATGYYNDGKTFIISAYCNGSDIKLEPWVTQSGQWYLTAKNPNSNVTINNTSIQIRIIILKI